MPFEKKGGLGYWDVLLSPSGGGSGIWALLGWRALLSLGGVIWEIKMMRRSYNAEENKSKINYLQDHYA